jgi:hypothetical protein
MLPYNEVNMEQNKCEQQNYNRYEHKYKAQHASPFGLHCLNFIVFSIKHI